MGCNWKNNAIKRMIWNIEGCNWKDNLIKRTIKNKKIKSKEWGPNLKGDKTKGGLNWKKNYNSMDNLK
jgi:hypothetical protein